MRQVSALFVPAADVRDEDIFRAAQTLLENQHGGRSFAMRIARGVENGSGPELAMAVGYVTGSAAVHFDPVAVEAAKAALASGAPLMDALKEGIRGATVTRDALGEYRVRWIAESASLLSSLGPDALWAVHSGGRFATWRHYRNTKTHLRYAPHEGLVPEPIPPFEAILKADLRALAMSRFDEKPEPMWLIIDRGTIIEPRAISANDATALQVELEVQ